MRGETPFLERMTLSPRFWFGFHCLNAAECDFSREFLPSMKSVTADYGFAIAYRAL